MKGQWAIPVIASILILGTLGLNQQAYGTTFTISDTPTGGDCLVLGGSWDAGLKRCTITNLTVSVVDNLVIVGVQLFINNSLINDGNIKLNGGNTFSSGFILVGAFGTLINNNLIEVNGGQGLFSGRIFMNIQSTFSNFGELQVNGGNAERSGAVQFAEQVSFVNHCEATVNLEGGIGRGSGILEATSFFLGGSTNFGTINMNGGSGDFSGGVFWFIANPPLLNHGSINSFPGSGFNSGTFLGLPFIDDPQPCNAPPDAVEDSAETLANVSVDIDVLFNDTDPDGDSLSIVSISSGPSDGVATIIGNIISYSPVTDFVGVDSFDYTISDGTIVSDPATVTITVLSAAEGSQNLLDLINTIGAPTGIETSLVASLGNASDLLNDMSTNNDVAACGKLDAFINKVNVQEGINNLSPEDADLLRGLAEDIKTSIGC